MNREDIHILSHHSNLSEERVSQALKENVYNDQEAWKKFLRLFFLSLGIGMTVSGIIFFFAYNWGDLHKFAKIGLTEGLLIATTSLLFFRKISETFKNFILFASSMLVGVIFAVFGQIYQTGANAYDFFLAWTLFVSIWVLISNFAPLWLLYLVLVNTTFILYSQQIAYDWSGVFIFTILFLFNFTALIISILLEKQKIPIWFTHILALATASFATIGFLMGLFEDFEIGFLALILLTILAFSLGIWHGLKTKSGFYVSIIAFSLIISTTSFFVKIMNGELGMYLFISLFIIICVTLTIKSLIELQKKWNNEN
jgi:uncharacterized membrane protein